MIIKMDWDHFEIYSYPVPPPAPTNIVLIVGAEPDKLFKVFPLYRCGHCHKFIGIFKRPKQCKHCGTEIFWKKFLK